MYISNTLASTTSHVGGEAAEPNSLYEIVGDVEEDDYTIMDGNSACQQIYTDANFSFGRNPAYGTNVAIAPQIETEQNAAYHCACDMATL